MSQGVAGQILEVHGLLSCCNLCSTTVWSLELHQLLVRRALMHAFLDATFAATYCNYSLSNLGVRTFNGGVIICVRLVPYAAFRRMSLPAKCATLDGHVDRSGARIDSPCSRVHLSSHTA